MARFKLEYTGDTKSPQAVRAFAVEFALFLKKQEGISMETAVHYAGDGETPTDILVDLPRPATPLNKRETLGRDADDLEREARERRDKGHPGTPVVPEPVRPVQQESEERAADFADLDAAAAKDKDPFDREPKAEKPVDGSAAGGA